MVMGRECVVVMPTLAVPLTSHAANKPTAPKALLASPIGDVDATPQARVFPIAATPAVVLPNNT